MSANPKTARSQRVRALMTRKGVTNISLSKLMDYSFSPAFIDEVIEGDACSPVLEERLAVVLGVTWDELFGPYADGPSGGAA